MTEFKGNVQGRNYAIEYDQTPDAIKGDDGQYLRESRYSDKKKYDSAQQDSAFIQPNAPDINKESLESFFSGAAREFIKEDKYSGSGTTASIAHISKDGILTVAHVGDSPVNIYIRDPKTGQIVGNHLVTRLHNPADLSKSEKEKMEAEGVVFSDDGKRIGSFLFEGKKTHGVMLARALGDYGVKGMSAKPEISTRDLKEYFKNGLEVIVTVESDGAIEARKGMKTPEVEKSRLDVLNGVSGSAGDLSSKLVQQAINNGATDNITSIAVILKGPPETNIIAAVFDGHGSDGGEASHMAEKFLQEKFDPKARAIFTINLDVLAKEQGKTASAALAPVTAPISIPKEIFSAQQSTPLWQVAGWDWKSNETEDGIPITRVPIASEAEALEKERALKALEMASIRHSSAFLGDTIRLTGADNVARIDWAQRELERIAQLHWQEGTAEGNIPIMRVPVSNPDEMKALTGALENLEMAYLVHPSATLGPTIRLTGEEMEAVKTLRASFQAEALANVAQWPWAKDETANGLFVAQMQIKTPADLNAVTSVLNNLGIQYSVQTQGTAVRISGSALEKVKAEQKRQGLPSMPVLKQDTPSKGQKLKSLLGRDKKAPR